MPTHFRSHGLVLTVFSNPSTSCPEDGSPNWIFRCTHASSISIDTKHLTRDVEKALPNTDARSKIHFRFSSRVWAKLEARGNPVALLHGTTYPETHWLHRKWLFKLQPELNWTGIVQSSLCRKALLRQSTACRMSYVCWLGPTPTDCPAWHQFLCVWPGSAKSKWNLEEWVTNA